jgi:hypothetical protein
MTETLLDRLRSQFSAGKKLSDVLKFLERKKLTSDQARDLCQFLGEQTDIGPLCDVKRHGAYDLPLYHLTMVFQEEKEEAAREILVVQGLGELHRLAELALAVEPPPAHALTMIAKMFAGYAYEPGLDVAAAIARRCSDEFWLSPAFQLFADEEHPLSAAFLDRLSDPLPDGFARVLTLDLANTLCRQGKSGLHPFNTVEGSEHLQAWLLDSDPENFSYAQSAAASLPFLDSDLRTRLASIAFDHLDPKVQMEAAWAVAYCGSESGLKILARFAEDPRQAATACTYLEELGKADYIPTAAQDPDFRAKAEMCEWLAHPSEFGATPDDIELIDTRELFWPPTDDERQLWLFRYCYKKPDGDDVGVGMVGSITFALFGETTAELSPEDIYGLHCCWELETNEDQRAPKKRTAAAGRKILGI